MLGSRVRTPRGRPFEARCGEMLQRVFIFGWMLAVCAGMKCFRGWGVTKNLSTWGVEKGVEKGAQWGIGAVRGLSIMFVFGGGGERRGEMECDTLGAVLRDSV